jgi:hypothetical protein
LIYFDYFLVRHLWVIILEKNTINIFLPRKGPPSLGYPYKKMAMKPLGGGDFELATPPANKQQTTSMADVNPRLIPF